MKYYLELKKKIQSKKAKICVVGLGYVGSEIIKKFNKEGFNTTGIDIDIKNIKKKHDFVKNINLTNNYKVIGDVDVIIIALPTPLTKNLDPDLSILRKSLDTMKDHLKKGQLISLESSSYPGTTEETIKPILKLKKFRISKNFFLVYSPERISPEIKTEKKGIKYNLHNTPKICAGYSNECLNLGKVLYKFITKKVVKSSSIKSAETAKMVENVFRSVNIALVNELKMFLHKIKIDINEVLDLAGTKPFGFTKFSPGPGYGGHCIPLDPFYLYWLAKKNNFELKFIKTAGLINRQITDWITKKIIKFVKTKKIKLKNNKVLILGVAYKKNIDDTRESPALIIGNKLKKKGIDFEYSDPYVKTIIFKNKKKYSQKINLKLLREYKIVIIVTDHTKFDYNLISKEAKYLFDCRNIIKNRKKNYFKV
jgi:UDP-N-acetyl-D-glucosamine dehydrogenase